MTQLLDPNAHDTRGAGIPLARAADTYERPKLTVLGTLRGLTRGAGPGGELIVMQTGIPGDPAQ